MEQISLADLDVLVKKAGELKKILQETPEIITYLQLVKDLGDEKAVMPIQTDVLIRAGQAATILGVDKSLIYRYVEEGRLRPYRTPPASHMKFWLSEVKAIPQKEVRAQ